MSRLLRNHGEASKLDVHCLDDADTQACLTQFRDLIGSCRGPNGKMKMIQNNVGGHLTVTSTSSRLLAAMSFSHPVLRIIVGTTQNHLANYKDGGLLLCHLCLLFLESSLAQTWNKRLVVAVYENCLSRTEEYLRSVDCSCRFDTSGSGINEMMSFLQCILVSKPLCGLYDDRLNHLSTTVLKSFLYSVPDDTERTYFSDRIYIQCMSDTDLLDSRLEKGILMSCPDLSSILEQTVELKRCVGNDKVKVLLVNVSMSGDAEELLDVHYEHDDNMDVNESMVCDMLDTCKGFVASGVGMVLSQKVMHPRIKAYLRSSGIFFVDRIGALLMPYLRDLTGASPVSSVFTSDNTDTDTNTFGWVDDAHHCVVSGKSYIHLTNTDSPVVSLVLCSSGEEVCSELKSLCSSVLLSLKRLVHQGSVVCGAGCWQTHVASFLRSQTDGISKTVNFPSTQISEIVENFARCLEKSATSLSHEQEIHMTDKSKSHFWKTPGTFDQSLQNRKCSCGLLSTDNSDELNFLGGNVSEKSCDSTCSTREEKRPQIVDSLEVVLSALQTAVYTANSILTTRQFIQDG